VTAVTQLTRLVTTPAFARATNHNSARVRCACSQSNSISYPEHIDCDRIAIHGAIAKLTVVVESPAFQRATRNNHASMSVTRSDRGGATHKNHVNRNGTVDPIATAELAENI